MADRKLVVAIIGDDRSLQQAFTRSMASADRFGRTIKSKLSVSGSFQGLLDDTRAMQKEAAGLSDRLDEVGTSGKAASTKQDTFPIQSIFRLTSLNSACTNWKNSRVIPSC